MSNMFYHCSNELFSNLMLVITFKTTGSVFDFSCHKLHWVTPVEDSYHQLRIRSGEEMRAKIQVQWNSLAVSGTGE